MAFLASSLPSFLLESPSASVVVSRSGRRRRAESWAAESIISGPVRRDAGREGHRIAGCAF